MLAVITFVIAVYFIIFRRRISTSWIRRSFVLYSVIFTITAIVISGMYIKEHKNFIIASITHVLPKSFIDSAIAKTSNQEQPIDEKESVQLKAPQISQLPELPRGCEVTSLAMLLAYHNIQADKMKLAQQIKIDPTPYQKTKEGIYFGHPNNGFVGDMYSFATPGLGVYHQPITELASIYAGNRVFNFTGQDFDEIIHQLNQDRPVLVIINATFKKLPKEQFITWQTPDGPIEVTMREHAVLVTGYDDKYIYFNDPLEQNNKAPRTEFKAAWKQMGKQAITIL
ncbi:C39 family peptidase [Lentibacillus sp. L22]|uniref:C39 family peptidase n=1 Tax=Lentibacillus TaxID=175304 RepID=UPI0022B09F4D|nr:C39 family peptidase [Lentibacillus daqui]